MAYHYHITSWGWRQTFVIRISGDMAYIYYNDSETIDKVYPIGSEGSFDPDDEQLDDTTFIGSFKFNSIITGDSFKSKITEDGLYGEEYDGNTVLLELDENRYLYVADRLMFFTSKSKIVSYTSPIVCYLDGAWPLAIDTLGYYYLLDKNTVLHPRDHPGLSDYDYPYEYFIDKFEGDAKYYSENDDGKVMDNELNNDIFMRYNPYTNNHFSYRTFIKNENNVRFYCGKNHIQEIMSNLNITRKTEPIDSAILFLDADVYFSDKQ